MTPQTVGRFGIAEVVGDAVSAQELRSCKIGGCCGKDTPPLSHGEVLRRLRSLPQWTISADRKVISRSLVAKNWKAAMEFLNGVSALAEEEGHHPDMHLTGWRNVQLDMSTHAIGGLSLPDMVLAAKIDGLPVECSPKWLKERASAEEQGFRPDEAMKERFAAVDRYVALVNAHDREGLLGMLASPCEVFGTAASAPASRGDAERYFDQDYPEVKLEVATPPRLASLGDPFTVRVGYTRSWRGGDGERQQAEVDELLTFGDQGRITHIGSLGAPAEPLPVA